MRKTQKTLKRFAGLGIFLLTITLSIVVYTNRVNSVPFLSTVSPQNTYEIRLFGQKERPFFFTAAVNFTVDRTGEPYINHTVLHEGDGLDISFESGFPNYIWQAENAIRFYPDENRELGESEKFVVRNESPFKLRYLCLQTIDKHLLLDVVPYSETSLITTKSRDAIRWLSINGQFSDGTDFKQFGYSRRDPKDLTHKITIMDSGIISGLKRTMD